jgi:tetratricopeptide (TPR) repeat protein
VYIHQDIAEPRGELLIFATCHGWPIRRGLVQFAPDFIDHWRIHYVESFHEAIDEILPLLPRIDILLAQIETAGDAPARLDRIRSLLRPDARVVLFPAIGYTPHWPQAFRDWNAGPAQPGKPWFVFGDRWVARRARRAQAGSEILSQYCALDMASEIDLDRLHDLWRIDAINKDRVCDIAITDIVEAEVRAGQAFFSPYHCSNRVVMRILDRMLAALGKQALLPGALQTEDILKDFELPIHPSVIRHFGLTHVTPTHRYLTMGGGAVTFEAFYRAYIESFTVADLAAATSLMQAARFEEAQKLLAMAETRSGKSVGVHLGYAEIRTLTGCYDAAINDAEAAIALDRTDARGYYWACHASFYKGDYLATINFGNACLVLARDETPHDILVWVADAQSRLGLPDLAIPAYRRALVKRPESPNAALGLAIALLRTGDQAEAQIWLSVVEHKSPQRLQLVSEFNEDDVALLKPFAATWPLASYVLGAKAIARGDILTAMSFLRTARRFYLSRHLVGMAELCEAKMPCHAEPVPA